MGQARWFDRIGPPSLMFATALMLAVVFPSAIRAVPPNRGGEPVPCPSFDVPAVARAAAASAPGAAHDTETLLDSIGSVTGRRLRLVTTNGARVAVTLPPESFVAPATGAVVVHGQHSPSTGSVVRALSLESGCDLVLARPAHVVRSAILDPAGTALYVHAVTADERADAGVTRFDLATGRSTSVLDPLPADDAFGPTFATELRWSAGGSELAVQSCGFSRCRTRIVDIESGHVETFAGAGHGSLIGVTSDTLIAWDACHWSPCAVLAIDRGTGEAATIAEEATGASLAIREGHPSVSVETAAGTLEVAP